MLVAQRYTKDGEKINFSRKVIDDFLVIFRRASKDMY